MIARTGNRQTRANVIFKRLEKKEKGSPAVCLLNIRPSVTNKCNVVRYQEY
jgi:hypothetical protein